jgi:hypothetical protein
MPSNGWLREGEWRRKWFEMAAAHGLWVHPLRACPSRHALADNLDTFLAFGAAVVYAKA